MLEDDIITHIEDDEFKELELITSSSALGVRESRRIIGEYRISTENILIGRIEFGSGEARSSVFRLMNFAEVTIDGDTSKYEI